MESTKYIGMDVHKEATTIAVISAAGKLVMESVVETERPSAVGRGFRWSSTRSRLSEVRTPPPVSPSLISKQEQNPVNVIAPSILDCVTRPIPTRPRYTNLASPEGEGFPPSPMGTLRRRPSCS